MSLLRHAVRGRPPEVEQHLRARSGRGRERRPGTCSRGALEPHLSPGPRPSGHLGPLGGRADVAQQPHVPLGQRFQGGRGVPSGVARDLRRLPPRRRLDGVERLGGVAWAVRGPRGGHWGEHQAPAPRTSTTKSDSSVGAPGRPQPHRQRRRSQRRRRLRQRRWHRRRRRRRWRRRPRWRRRRSSASGGGVGIRRSGGFGCLGRVSCGAQAGGEATPWPSAASPLSLQATPAAAGFGLVGVACPSASWSRAPQPPPAAWRRRGSRGRRAPGRRAEEGVEEGRAGAQGC